MNPQSPTIEHFDIVDGYDRVIGRASREQIHKKKLFHRAVHIFVFNSDGAVFLQRRSMNKDTAPGRWVSSCSGHVDSGEYYYDAAIRELGEEIGLYDPKEFSLLFIDRPRPETGYEHVHVFQCYAEGPLRLNKLEVSEGKWVMPDRVNEWVDSSPRDFAWSFVYLWKRFSKMNSK
jgi:isopentenyl-diphosphate delta-isomerase type 1